MRDKELEGPLVLLVSTRSAECQSWPPLSHRERRAQRRPRPLTTFDVVRMLRVEVEHLRPRAQAKAQALDHRRALQPPAARRAGDEVAVTVSHGDVDRVAPDRAQPLRSRAGPVSRADLLRVASRQAGRSPPPGAPGPL